MLVKPMIFSFARTARHGAQRGSCALGGLVLWVATTPGAMLAGATCFHPEGNLAVEHWGDVNRSGEVNVADAVCLGLVALAELTAEAYPACALGPPAEADLNCDGIRTVADLQVVIRVALQLGLGPLDGTLDGCPDACAPCVPPAGVSCFIDGACVPAGASALSDACVDCAPGASLVAWTAKSEGAGCGGGLICLSGVCVQATPSAPAVESVVLASSGATLVVTPPEHDGGQAVSEYRAVCEAGGTTIQATSATATVVVTGLSPGVEYACAVAAVNALGEGDFSPPVLLTPCAVCAPGQGCDGPDFCDSGVCAGSVCQAPSCSDGVQNGTESDVDCGGPSCSACEGGAGCLSGADCLSGLCSGAMCGDVGAPASLVFGGATLTVDPIEGQTPGPCTSVAVTNAGGAVGGAGLVAELTGAGAWAFSFCQPDSPELCGGALSPGETCFIGVQLSATEDGGYGAELQVESVDGLFASVALQAQASQLSPALAQPAVELAVFPVTIHTGSPGPCTPLPITNTGGAVDEAIEITFSGTHAAHFEACSNDLPDPCGPLVAPGQTCDLGARLLAEVDGVYTAQAHVAGQGGGSQRPVRGEAYGLTPQLSIGSGTLTVAELTTAAFSDCVPLTVTNVGTGVGGGSYSLSFTGSHSHLFQVCMEGLSQPCSAPLAPGESCELGVRFGTILSGTFSATARVDAAGGLTASRPLQATATGASLLCPYVGPGWCRSYSYPYPAGTTLAQALQLCADDAGCVAVSTYQHCSQSAGDTCGNWSQSSHSRCTDLDFSIWPSGYATFVCPAPILSLGSGVLDLPDFTGNTSPCYSLEVTNDGGAAGGGPYSLSFTGGQASAFQACTDGLAAPCTGPLSPGQTCELGVRVSTTVGGLHTTTAVLSTPGANTPTRSLRVHAGGIAAALTLSPSSLHVASLSGQTQSGCVPISVQNTGNGTGGGSFSMSFFGSDAARFGACTSGLVSPCGAPLSPGASCNMGVIFSTSTNGSFSATAHVSAAGGLSAEASLTASASGLGTLSCPYFSAGWCNSYTYFPLGTTLGGAMTQCLGDPSCYGISTYTSCGTTAGSTCDSTSLSLFSWCSDWVFTMWPSGYTTYKCH